jgi:hypothetical protein
MKLKKFLLIGLIAAIALMSSACASTPAATVEGDEKDKAVAMADPFTQDILNGIQNNDYTTFAKDFDAAMAKAMTESQFKTLTDSLSKLGAYKGYEVSSVESVDAYYRVNYKVTYESGSFTMRVVVPKEGTPAVTGLWFK